MLWADPMLETRSDPVPAARHVGRDLKVRVKESRERTFCLCATLSRVILPRKFYILNSKLILNSRGVLLK